MYILISTNNFFTVATSKVTNFKTFKRYGNSIQAHWRELAYPAMKLEITATCKYDCDNGQIYLVNKTVLPPNETSITFTGLAPGSQCHFMLKATYNPASFDDGISVPYMVLPASKMFTFHTKSNSLYALLFT